MLLLMMQSELHSKEVEHVSPGVEGMLEGANLVVRLSHRARVKNDSFVFFVTISLEAEPCLHLVLLFGECKPIPFLTS